MLIVKLNRYNGADAAKAFISAPVTVELDWASIELEIGKDHEIDISFIAEGGEFKKVDYDFAYKVVCNLDAFDNIVQQACAEECRQSGLHSDNFESCLAGLKIYSDRIKFHYWGDVVNTEWDEVFSFINGSWIHTHSGTGLGSSLSVSI